MSPVIALARKIAFTPWNANTLLHHLMQFYGDNALQKQYTVGRSVLKPGMLFSFSQWLK